MAITINLEPLVDEPNLESIEFDQKIAELTRTK